MSAAQCLRNNISWSIKMFVGAALAIGISGGLYAQGLTYVDADDFVSVNLSTSSGDPLGNAIDQFETSTNVGGDNLWRIRGTTSGNMFGASGTVYEAFSSEDNQELVQTVTGLSSGTSYDMYAVWWSATNESWTLRAGLTSDPGGNPIYDRLGAFGNPADMGVFTNWTTAPIDNADIADGFPGIQGATLEGNRVMLVAKIGTATANGSGQVQVFIDDTTSAETGNRSWFDGVAYAPAGAASSNLSATIDRSTGNLSITSTTDFDITAVNLTSAAGSLLPNAWSPITGNLDGAGSSLFDGDNWEITSQTVNSLAEQEIDRDPDPEVVLRDGGTVGPGGAATIDLGNVWLQSPFEDVILNLTLNDSGFTVPVTVEFTGGAPIQFGDLNSDGSIDVDDYAVVLNNLNNSYAGLSDVQSYVYGDLTGNQLTNYNDLVRFRELYDDANGAGSFVADLGSAAVPEPSSILLLGLGAVAFGAVRLRGAAKALGTVALLLAACVFATKADAQITYIDSDLSASPSSNTSISGGAAIANDATGGWNTRGAGAVLTEDSASAADTSNFGINGNTLQGTTTAVDELVTTFTIPTAGDYDIFAFFWDDEGSELWNVEAGLASGVLTHYDPTVPGTFAIDATTQVSGGAQEIVSGLNVLGQGSDDFTDFIDGNRILYGAKVGTTTVTAGGSVDVYFDHDETLPSRTFFDGVGYAVAVPEPSLLVNTSTGEVVFDNPTSDPVTMSYYEIRSASGSLNGTGWNSLDDQNIDAVDGPDAGSTAGDSLLEGWDEAGTAPSGDFNEDGTVDAADYTVWRDGLGGEYDEDDYTLWANNFGATNGALAGTILNETNLLNTTTIAAGSSLSLGNAFTVGGAEDLVFNYGLVGDGSLNPAFVKYGTSGSLDGGANVPEPSTLALLGLAGVAATLWRRNG